MIAEVSESVPKDLRGDPSRIRQILVNLIGNAVKFTPQGSVTLSVTPCRLADGLEGVRFAVRDTGIGIPTKIIDSLFDDFVQADTSTSRRYAGTGLGLSISRRLVELMGGTISVLSEEGKGSEFSFDIPAAVASGAADKSAQPVVAAAWRATEQLRILVAEDNDINQLIINQMLGQFGHHIVFAGNGRIAVEKFNQGDFDLVLMDIRMPEMNGVEAARTILKSSHNAATIPIIALTADAVEGRQREYRNAGMVDCVVKPINLRILLTAIDKALGRKIHEPAANAAAAQPTARTREAAAPEPINDDVLSLLSEIEKVAEPEAES